MSDRAAETPAKGKNEIYEVKPGDTLWSLAYEHVLPPHSDPSVDRCINNIVDNNKWPNGVPDLGKELNDRDFLRIPRPCDPQDAPKQQFPLEKTSSADAAYFANHDPLQSASKLSESLVNLTDSLSTDKRTYNYLIEKIYAKTDGLPGSHIAAEHWNSQTHSWDKVFVYGPGYPKEPPVRIFQPGNTIEGIADDRMQYLRNQGYKIDSKDFIRRMKDLNGFNDDKSPVVGQPVKLPAWPPRK